MAKTLGHVGNLIKDHQDAKTRASLKGAEIAKLGSVARKSCGDFEIEVVRFNAIDGGVEVFARAWENGEQLGFGNDGTVDIERFRIFNPPILVPDGTQTLTEVNGEPKLLDNFKEDLEQAVLQSLAHTIKVKKEKRGPERIVAGKVGNTTSTFYPDASYVDGFVENLQSGGVTWATLHDATAGTTASTQPAETTQVRIQSYSSSPNWRAIYRAFQQFDTSAIGDSDTISAATLSLYGFSKSDTASFALATNIYSSTPASLTAIATGDFDQVGTTAFSSDLSYASFNTAAYNDFALNASGIAAISKTGASKFSWRAVKDADNTPPTHPGSQLSCEFAIHGSGYTGTSRDPKLVVEHATPTADPSVTDDVTVTEAVTMMVDENPTVFDSVTITEAVTMESDLNINVFDGVTITEDVAAEVSGPIYEDSVTVTEVVTVVIEFLVPEVFDSVTATEAVTMESDLNINIFDSVTVTESVAGEQINGFMSADDVTASEDVQMMMDLNINVFDAVTVTEPVTAIVAAAKDGLIRMRSTEQSYPLMMDDDTNR